jgi:hypothetical protein
LWTTSLCFNRQEDADVVLFAHRPWDTLPAALYGELIRITGVTDGGVRE